MAFLQTQSVFNAFTTEQLMPTMSDLFVTVSMLPVYLCFLLGEVLTSLQQFSVSLVGVPFFAKNKNKFKLGENWFVN